ncbi:MAG: hypothetical protein WKG07_13805 [Hymenobacter sp.]
MLLCYRVLPLPLRRPATAARARLMDSAGFPRTGPCCGCEDFSREGADSQHAGHQQDGQSERGASASATPRTCS